MSGQRDSESNSKDAAEAAQVILDIEIARAIQPPVAVPIRLRQSVVALNGQLLFLVLMNGRMSSLQIAAETKSVQSSFPTLFSQPATQLEICFVTEASPVGAAFKAVSKELDSLILTTPIKLEIEVEAP